MCAIAGLIDLYFDPKIAADMLDTMRRRGPDESGVYTDDPCYLLHSRLAIIDLDGGKQPMVYNVGQEQFCLVYNGELYNTEELRDELLRLGHHFSGHSDTEVVLHAYMQWGEDCLLKMNGIFAFAVWEKRKKRLFVARDRMGVKPLFYILHRGGFLFASEIKTLLQYPTVEACLDADGAAQILLLGPGRTPGSGVFKDVLELEPGCCGVYCQGKWNWRRYWKLTDRAHEDSFPDTVEKVRFLVTDSIKRQMVSDVPIGTFLSGGLDSSIITAVCSEELTKRGEVLSTYSVDYENNERFFVPGKFQPNSDNSFIQIMQSSLNTDHHWTVLTPYDLITALHDATLARDLPGMADVDFSLLAFSKNIRQDVKVALSGECADEIFGGYPWFRDPQIRDLEGFPWAQNTAYRATFLTGELAQKIDPVEFVGERYDQTMLETDVLPGTSALEKRMKQMVNLNYRWFMQTLLDRKDRMSMYNSLEVRVPFCDHRIAEYLYGVPWEFKDHNGREKGLLRLAMEGLLPDEILWRKKSPYPKTHDPRYMQIVTTMLQEVLADNASPIFQIVNKKALSDLVSANSTWPWYGQLMRIPQTIAYMLQINFWLSYYKIKVV